MDNVRSIDEYRHPPEVIAGNRRRARIALALFAGAYGFFLSYLFFG